MIFLKKKRGESVVSGTAMLGLIVCALFVVITLFFNYYSTIHATEEVNMVARTYLLQMELGNCLEQDEVTALVDRLTELGMSDIQLSGNFDYSVTSENIKKNEYPASYGEEVYLLIEGILNVGTKTVRFLGTNIDLSKPTIDLSVQKKGVAVK